MIENCLKVCISFCVKKSSFDDKKTKILTRMYGFTENGLCLNIGQFKLLLYN